MLVPESSQEKDEPGCECKNLPLKVAHGKKMGGDLPLFARSPIKSVAEAKRMLGKLIHGFQLGRIDSVGAKTLTYMLLSWCQIVKDGEFEERLSQLEAKHGKKS